MLLLQLFDEYRSLLVLASLVLKPDANDPRTEPGHLDQLVLHQSVGSRVCRVACPQRVQLFFVEHRSYPRRLRRRRAALRLGLVSGAARRHVTRRATSASGAVLLSADDDGATSRWRSVTCKSVNNSGLAYECDVVAARGRRCLLRVQATDHRSVRPTALAVCWILSFVACG